MFMPQAQPHLSRSHGPPGTARRARVGDKENAGALPSKTPSRAPLGKAGPSGRALGARTVDRNVQTQKPSEEIAPKRLFQNDEKKSQKAPLRLKTPGPRMKTPGPRAHMRTPAPQIYHDEPTPAPLPSAQRTRRRSRASLQSPPEDADMSLDSILEVAVEVVPELAEEDDYELEYAPPTAIDRPYVPEWAESIPDPVETMATLAQIRPMSLRTPPSPVRDSFHVSDIPTISLCPDDDLNHPLLRTRNKMATQQSKAKAVSARPLVRPSGISAPSNAASRSATSSALRATAATARPATATGGIRSTAASAARIRSSASVAAPKRPVSATAAATAGASVRPASSSSAARTTSGAGPIRTASSAAPRTTSAAPIRPVSSQTTASRSVRPATSAEVRTALRINGTASASGIARPTASRFTRLPPRIGKVVKAPPRPASPGPVMPAAENDLLDLDPSVLDEKDAAAKVVEEVDEPSQAQAEKVPTPMPVPQEEKGESIVAPTVPELAPRTRAVVSPAPASPCLTLSPATSHPLALTPTPPMSPLMSPRLATSPFRDDVFDFAALTAALPSIGTSTPEEHIEMSPLAEPTEFVPTPPGGQPDLLVITFANRRLARISERTEVDSSFDDSFHTSFDASFDGADATG
ncbi:hypothetical protein CC85DRAFT_302339 [Cutaneotrichosporon oleaginosum]|uniref:Uncharacterized protein n=1 Tax=Cutaneotrichosporon oleaginosum TaxID=879819 RepID=A0A0J1B4A5_9TREE|nr:uncharacterized protein CC85DRAFT_302339 [Cutaneotrichosporon oleaginosum]KLT42479.1 hypothetical protein CC85DRAFT_302339 [Cutaneotrichosporon oleaginosum]TXT06998.1 hypothetical protein COLE_06329 [Cutaneotrichosporon oleaginosum]